MPADQEAAKPAASPSRLAPLPVTLIPVDGDQESDSHLSSDVFAPLTIKVTQGEGGLDPLEGVLVDFTLEGPTLQAEPQEHRCPTNALGQASSPAFAPLAGPGTYTLTAELHNTDDYHPAPSSLNYDRTAPEVLVVASLPKRCYLAGGCPLRLRVIRPATEADELSINCTLASDTFQLSATPQSPPAPTGDAVTDEDGNFILFLRPVKPLDPTPATIALHVSAEDSQRTWTAEIPCPQILLPTLIDVSTGQEQGAPASDGGLDSGDGQALVPLTIRAMGPGPDDDPVDGQQLGDQPLPDIAVDFSVTDENGQTRSLGTRYTDAHGEATSPPSLGPYAGRGTYTLTAQLSPPSTAAIRGSSPAPAQRTSIRTPGLEGPTAVNPGQPLTFAYTVKQAAAEGQVVSVFRTNQDPLNPGEDPFYHQVVTGASGTVTFPGIPHLGARDYLATLTTAIAPEEFIHLAEPLTFTVANSTLTTAGESFPAGQDITFTYEHGEGNTGNPNAVICLYTEMEGPPSSGEQGPGALDTYDATDASGTVTFPAESFTTGTFITDRNFTAYLLDMGDGTSELDDYRWLSVPCHITVQNTPWINNFTATYNANGTISATGRCGPYEATVESFSGSQNDWVGIGGITDNTFTNNNIPAGYELNDTTLRLRVKSGQETSSLINIPLTRPRPVIEVATYRNGTTNVNVEGAGLPGAELAIKGSTGEWISKDPVGTDGRFNADGDDYNTAGAIVRQQVAGQWVESDAVPLAVPPPEITSPADGSTVTGPCPPITVTGRPDSTVTLKTVDNVVATGTITDTDGLLTLTPTENLPNGTITLTITQTLNATESPDTTLTIQVTPPWILLLTVEAPEMPLTRVRWYSDTAPGARLGLGDVVTLLGEADLERESGDRKNSAFLAGLPDGLKAVEISPELEWDETNGYWRHDSPPGQFLYLVKVQVESGAPATWAPSFRADGQGSSDWQPMHPPYITASMPE